ncbi:MAG: Rrf2 family transcriptional regulator [Ruthenibacterium sp.]
MQFSTKGRYALRLMIDLALHSDGVAVPLKEIAARQDISVKYLEQIVPPLARAGLVQSVRGAGGGYRLAHNAAVCTAGDILRAAEGGLAPVACLVHDTPACARTQACAALHFWKGMQSTVEQYADSVTLESLTALTTQGDDYCI